MKFILFLLPFCYLLGNTSEVVYSKGDALKPFIVDGELYITGLKHRGLFRLEGKSKKEILSSKYTVSAVKKENQKIVATTTHHRAILTQKNIQLVKKDSTIIKTTPSEQIALLSNGIWGQITDGSDKYYLVDHSGNQILYAGLKTGLVLYNKVTHQKNIIGKGVHASFSTNGEKIIYATIKDDGLNYTESTLYIYDIASKKSTICLNNGAVNLYPILNGDSFYYQHKHNIYMKKIQGVK